MLQPVLRCAAALVERCTRAHARLQAATRNHVQHGCTRRGAHTRAMAPCPATMIMWVTQTGVTPPCVCAVKTVADIRQLKKAVREEEMGVVNSQNELAKLQVCF